MAKELETRKCVITGQITKKENLLRFIVLDDGRLLPDFNKKLGGRGIYISNSKAILENLIAKNSLNKILHKKITIDANIVSMVEDILAKKGLDALNLARKAGSLVLGFEKVKDIVNKGKAAFVIEASDAGEDGKQKIATIAKNLDKFSLYDVANLDKALGRDNTVYLVVTKSNISSMVYDTFKRYQTFLNT